MYILNIENQLNQAQDYNVYSKVFVKSSDWMPDDIKEKGVDSLVRSCRLSEKVISVDKKHIIPVDEGGFYRQTCLMYTDNLYPKYKKMLSLKISYRHINLSIASAIEPYYYAFWIWVFDAYCAEEESQIFLLITKKLWELLDD